MLGRIVFSKTVMPVSSISEPENYDFKDRPRLPRVKNFNRVIIAYPNIKSIRKNKIKLLSEVVKKNTDICMVSKNKINESSSQSICH